jgi:glycosyltransferase involved in cell wall biosynthesis
MKMGISAFAGDNGKSGISQYMKHVLKRMPQLSDNDSYVLFMSKSDRSFFDFEHPRIDVVTVADWVGKPMVNILWHLFYLPALLSRHNCDCVYMPAGNRRLAWWYGLPSIGTVHDLSQLHVPGKYDAMRMFYATKILPRMMQRLTHVISVSKSTRKDLVNFAGVNPERIDVVYNGADLEHYSPDHRDQGKQLVLNKYGITNPYILYTARLEHPGKNHVNLLDAFARLKEKSGLPHHLVLAGSPWYGADAIYAVARDLGIEEFVCFAGFVNDSDLPSLYAGADLFVFPSLFEGFGIPLLEAMASGTPVCASNVSSIPEVVKNAGLLFDPEDADDMAASMLQIILDNSLRKKLIQRGLRQSALFSWDDSARQVHNLCHVACNSIKVAV